MSNLVRHAKHELEQAGWLKDEGMYGDLIGKAVLELVETFAKQGHSGGSAPIVISLFEKLANWEAITPLTCEDDEWMLVAENHYQNKRNPSVFKDENGVYFLDAVVFRMPDGACFTGTSTDGITSRQYFTPPFVPKTFYVDVDEGRNIANPSQVHEAFKYCRNDA
jgi:hypothetical protein